ncbi:MAG: poly(R)-hydroxyalkanoic acid synthase subunit PhaE [Rhodanobacter sp.]
MVDPASDFMRDYQALAQQSWDGWARQFQQAPATNPFAPPSAPAAGNETLERTLAGLKGYFDWMQAAVAGGGAIPPGGDWQQQLQQMFGGTAQPFAQAFGSIDSASAESFTRQWQSWWQAAQQSGFGGQPSMHGATPTFGLNREQQMQQQTLAAALLASLQASARYQQLIQQASTKGMQLLQNKLAEHAEPGRQIDSMKGLYDLWVDASEEAYADIALSDEFRNAYGEMVNTQMRVRQLQQEQTERFCRELGVPTRSEVSSLGERLQALRREVRAGGVGGFSGKADHAGNVGALEREVAALKRQLAQAAATAAKPRATKEAAATKSAVKKAPVKKAAVKRVAVKKVAVRKGARTQSAAVANESATKSTRKPAAAASSRSGSRKRK